MSEEDQRNASGIVLLSTEVELYTQALQPFPIEEIGSKKWSSQSENIKKLNMQAILSASKNETEYVRDFLVTFDKIPVLIHELIAVELWTSKVFPQLFKIDFKPKNTFIIYLIMYQEATIVNLLETVLYHQDACQTLGDTVYDLVDYCSRKLAEQIRIFETNEPKDKEKNAEEDPIQELAEQKEKMQFEILMKLFSIIRYIVDNLANLPLGVTNRILNTHDFILLLVKAIDMSIWSRKDKDGKLQKFVDNKWKIIPESERLQMTKIEGQVWIALYELMLNPQCASKYEYTEYKKNQILKLRHHMNQVLFDQIPQLGALQRFLEQMAVSELPACKSDLVIEQVPEIYDSFVAKHKGKWKELARMHANTVLSPSDEEVREQAKRWAATYDTDALETLIDEPAKCPECGHEAAMRCSRCKNEWYCRRECQVNNWPKHKKTCDVIFEANQKAAQLAANASRT